MTLLFVLLDQTQPLTQHQCGYMEYRRQTAADFDIAYSWRWRRIIGEPQQVRERFECHTWR